MNLEEWINKGKPLNVILNCDCMKFMEIIEDNYFQLSICDPPYGHNCEIIANNRSRSKLAIAKNYGKGEWNKKSPDKKYFIELKRISLNQIIWGINYYNLYWGSGRIIWDKDNGNNDFSDCEIAYQSFSNSVRKYKYKWNGMFQENMKNKEKRIHPTQKPIALYRWLLQKYAKPGDLIFDSHSGSGSLAIACIEEKFNFIACELDPDYYKASIERLQPYLDQGNLF